MDDKKVYHFLKIQYSMNKKIDRFLLPYHNIFKNYWMEEYYQLNNWTILTEFTISSHRYSQLEIDFYSDHPSVNIRQAYWVDLKIKMI